MSLNTANRRGNHDWRGAYLADSEYTLDLRNSRQVKRHCSKKSERKCLYVAKWICWLSWFNMQKHFQWEIWIGKDYALQFFSKFLVKNHQDAKQGLTLRWVASLARSYHKIKTSSRSGALSCRILSSETTAYELGTECSELIEVDEWES